MNYRELIGRLNTYSAENQCHGGITAEAAGAIETLLVERYAAELEKLKIFCELKVCSRCPFDYFLDEHPEIDDCSDVVIFYPNEALKMMNLNDNDGESK